MAKLLIGWSEVSITPEKKISLAGQFAERISEYVEKPLTVTALAVDSGAEQLVLVSCDIASVGYGLLQNVRKAIREKNLGLDPEKILLSAIHTHTGPKYSGVRSRAELPGVSLSHRAMLETFLAPGQKYVEKVNVSSNPDIATNDEVAQLLAQRIAQAVEEAWTSRAPGSFANGFERAVVGMCRRAAYSDNTAQMWGDTNTAVFDALEGGNDSGVELLYFFDENKALTGVVANLACPAQCVQHRLFVSPDFWGEVKTRIRAHFGEKVFLLAQCSAAGDQCPVDLVRWVEPESDLNDPNCKRNDPPKRKADPSMFDLAGMYKAGKRVANAIIDAWQELEEPQEDPEFIHRVQIMKLPIRRATLTDVAKAQAGIREYLRDKGGKDVDYNDVANLQVHLGVIVRSRFQELVDVLDTEIHVIRLGPVAMASNPFELFLDYGNQIKARSPAEQTFLVQLANGAEGYLPTEKAEVHGHYSAFLSSGKVGHQGGEQLVRQTLQTIRELF